MASPAQLYALLHQYWGHADFRPLQQAIINDAVQGRDVLAVLPTGGGKSLCYQLGGLARGGLTIVISPLIALMQDQVQQLRGRGLRAAFINSTQAPDEADGHLRDALAGKLQFLYLAPERLGQRNLRSAISRMQVALLAVDEAHCISQWGYDFRPAYADIPSFRGFLPREVPVMALTATATPEARADIVQQLKLQNHQTHLGSFYRPELRYVVRNTTDKTGKLLEVLRKTPGSSIVYVRTRQTAEKLAGVLRQEGITCQHYHGALPATERAQTQQDWVQGSTRVVVATNAFGLGIDKADVRSVIHYQLPPDVESYYQEAGRAGRDAKRAYAVLLVDEKDEQLVQRQLASRYPPYTVVLEVYERLCDQYQIDNRSTDTAQTHSLDTATLADRLGRNEQQVVGALRMLELGQLISLQGQRPQARLHVLWQHHEILEYKDKHPQLAAVIDFVLRQLGGRAFVHPVGFDLHAWAQRLGTPRAELHQRLSHLHNLQVWHYQPTTTGYALRFLQPRQALTPASINYTLFDNLARLAQARLHQLLHYVQQHTQCRAVVLSAYFGEQLTQPCGHCDVCGQQQPKTANIHEQLVTAILALLATRSYTYTELLQSLQLGSPTQRGQAIRQLLQDEQIELRNHVHLHLRRKHG